MINDDDKLINVTFSITRADKRRLDECATPERSRSSIVRIALRREFDRQARLEEERAARAAARATKGR